MSELIRTDNLEKRYSVGDAEVIALKSCNLTLEKGEQLAIMGPSGSGKSTLLSLIGGLMTPTSGSVTVAGECITNMNSHKLSVFRRRNIGFVFQSFNLIPEMTAKQNILLPLMLDGKSVDKEYFGTVCDTLGLADRLHHLPGQLSGGQQQRVAIARAIITKPSLILCDEPTGNLDSASGREVMELLRSVCAGSQSTLVVVTHDSTIANSLLRKISIYDGEVRV